MGTTGPSDQVPVKSTPNRNYLIIYLLSHSERATFRLVAPPQLQDEEQEMAQTGSSHHGEMLWRHLMLLVK